MAAVSRRFIGQLLDQVGGASASTPEYLDLALDTALTVKLLPTVHSYIVWLWAVAIVLLCNLQHRLPVPQSTSDILSSLVKWT